MSVMWGQWADQSQTRLFMGIRLIATTCCVGALLLCRVQDQDDLVEKPEPRLVALAQRARDLKIKFADDSQRAPPQLMPSPVLRTNDATRSEVEGAVWLWLDGKRPVA